MEQEKLFWFWLCNIPQIGRKTIAHLLEHFDTPKEIFYANKEQLEGLFTEKSKKKQKLIESRNLAEVEKSYNQMLKNGIHFVCLPETAYPDKLRHIPDKPIGIFFRGNLPKAEIPCVAVVGARDASRESIQLARKFGRELAENGIQVISGMARGIDISAQRGVLATVRGRTYSALGTGIDICYPRQHIEEFMQMQEYGGVFTEFPMKTPPLPYQFPMRNRLISAFADGILVIEAREKSGSLITAELGLEQGKDIFVIPGKITDTSYAGSNKLIQNGACLVTKTKDILDGLGLFFDEDVVERKKKSKEMLETTEEIVYAILSLEPIHVAQIIEETGLELSDVLQCMASLQEKNLVQVVGNNYYIIKL